MTADRGLNCRINEGYGPWEDEERKQVGWDLLRTFRVSALLGVLPSGFHLVLVAGSVKKEREPKVTE